MLAALIKGKLSREQENMEDILTSNVFGLMQYLPPRNALIPFLSQAEYADGAHPFTDLQPEVQVECKFWPWIEEPGCLGCEPDVVMRLTEPDRNRRLVFVEAKYLSGKSSEEDPSIVEPYDQLAREWDNLASLAKRGDADPLLLYVTADVGLPRQEIAAAAKTYSRKRCNRTDAQPFTCAWLSWRKLSTVFRGAQECAQRDLCELANHLALCYFETLTWFNGKPLGDWRFAATPQDQYHWQAPGRTAEIWSFS